MRCDFVGDTAIQISGTTYFARTTSLEELTAA